MSENWAGQTREGRRILWLLPIAVCLLGLLGWMQALEIIGHYIDYGRGNHLYLAVLSYFAGMMPMKVVSALVLQRFIVSAEEWIQHCKKAIALQLLLLALPATIVGCNALLFVC